MLFSLVIGTLNRPNELSRCLDSLFAQTVQDFEIIIVDQSDNDQSTLICKKYGFPIKYYKERFKCLSKARNLAIENSCGDYICLIDDDAIYDKNYLLNAKLCLNSKIILSGVIYSIDDLTTPFIDCSKLNDKKRLTTNELLKYSPSAALVIPSVLFKKNKCHFNESIGVGNKFAACEETDILLKAIDCGMVVVHNKEMILFHPVKPFNLKNKESIIQHAMGKGAIFKIDFVKRKKIRLFIFALKNTVGMMFKFLTSSSAYRIIYFYRLKGFIKGITEYKINGD